MSTEENKALVNAFWKVVYEDRDYERVADFFNAKARYEDVPVPEGPGIGPQGIVKRLRHGHESVEAFDHEIHRMIAEADTVMTEHTETWRFHTGEVIPLPFLSVHVIRNGKFDLWRDYSTLATVISGAPAWWLEHAATGKPEDFIS